MRNYEFLLSRFCGQLGDRELNSLTTETILSFRKDFTEGTKQSTKKLRYSLLSAFFNFIRNSLDPTFQNPCDNPILKKLFRHAKPNHWKIVEKDVDDRKVIIRDPKSGKEGEAVFLPQKVAERLKEYIRDNAIEPEKRIFPISYPAARMVVKKAGKLVGIDLKPHDLHVIPSKKRQLCIDM